MKRLFSKIAALSVGLAMAVGVGVALGHRNVERVSATDASITISTLGWGSSTQNAFGEANAQAIDANTSFYFSGGGNAGKYYTTSPAGARMYYGGSDSITVKAGAGYKLTSVTFTYAIKNGGCLHTSKNTSVTAAYASGSAVALSNVESVTAYIASTGTATNSQVAIQQIAVSYNVSTDPAVSITNAPAAALEIGATGTLTASSINATSPVYTWSSNNTDVLTIDASTGEYEAVAYGKAVVTVSMTCTEGSASKTATIIVNAGLISIADARTIIEGLASGVTTDYEVTIEGYLINLNGDNQAADKVRAFTVSTKKVGETGGVDLLVYGVYSSDPVRAYAILNASVRYTGKLQNYTKDAVTTYELTSPKLDSYVDDAITYARAAYLALDEACEVGPASVTDEQWTTLATSFNALDEYAQAKLSTAAADDDNEDIAKWIGRYVRIVNAGKSNFMNSSAVSVLYRPAMINEQNIGFVIVVSIIATSAIAFGLFFMLRKRKEK